MAAGHFVADGDLALLRDVDAHDLVDAGAHLVAVLAGEDLDVDYDAALAVGNLQRGVAHLAGLLAEDGAQQALLGGEVGLALGGDLADQYVAAANLGAHADYAALVEVLERVVAHAGDVAGDLLGAELGVAGVALVLLHVDGSEGILHDEALVEQDGVLVVVALPVHVADQDVLAEADLAVAGGRAVGEHVALFDPVARVDDGALVDAGALVGAGELYELVVLYLAAIIAHDHVGGAGAYDRAAVLGEYAHAGVDGALVLDAGGDYGSLGGQQRHGLALHVRAHKCAVGVVVLEEGYHGRGDGDHHARGDVDVVDALAVDVYYLVTVAAGDTLVLEAAVLVQRLGGLGDDVAGPPRRRSCTPPRR